MILEQTNKLLLGKFNRTQVVEPKGDLSVYTYEAQRHKTIETYIEDLIPEEELFKKYRTQQSLIVVELYKIAKKLRAKKMSSQKIEEIIIPAISNLSWWLLNRNQEILLTKSKNESGPVAHTLSLRLKELTSKKKELLRLLKKEGWDMPESKIKIPIKFKEAHIPKLVLKRKNIRIIENHLRTLSYIQNRIRQIEVVRTYFSKIYIKNDIKTLYKNGGLAFTKNVLKCLTEDLSKISNTKNSFRVLNSYLSKVIR